jgi:hypothetical protein
LETKRGAYFQAGIPFCYRKCMQSKQKAKEYREKNKVRLQEYFREYHIKNREKKCLVAKKYYKDNKEKVILRVRKYNKDNKKRFEEEKKRKNILYQAGYRKNNLKKISAQNKINGLIRYNKMAKGICCLKDKSCYGRIEGHHPDYSKPLEIIWLCQSHHQRTHTGSVKINIK